MKNTKLVKSIIKQSSIPEMSMDGAKVPKINLISLLAGALALASVFLPWWGMDASGFGSTISPRWTLWNAPNSDSIFRGSSQQYSALATYGPVIGAIVIISALLALAGSFVRNARPLVASFILNVLTPIAYLGIVSYAVTNACGAQGNCLSGPFGSQTFPFGIMLSWGFQLGFYLYITAGALTLIGIGFHGIFYRARRAADGN
jgi:hypothetical protein